MTQPTLFGLSSGAPPAAIGVIRVSGSMAGDVLRALTARALPPARHTVVRRLLDPVSRETLDDALVIWLPGPETVTGDDLVELHVHGGRAVVRATLERLAAFEGLVAAPPGGFTRRAFENGKIDLSQVEGLGDLLAAETEGQRRSALAMAEGRLGERARNWRRAILSAAAAVEAQLDFSDEDDVGKSLDKALLVELSADLTSWCEAPTAERLRDGVRVVLAGPPNAGKSSLLNALVGRDAAITSPIAGTTRDIVEVPTTIEGIPFVFIDTAGLHDATDDEIEQEGIRRAHNALEVADIVLWLDDVRDTHNDSRALQVVARCDVRDKDAYPLSDTHYYVSARTSEGLANLRKAILERARLLIPSPGDMALNLRQRKLIALLASDVSDALMTDDLLLAAEHLRLARTRLDQLIGQSGVEDMLDALFGGFCIGK